MALEQLSLHTASSAKLTTFTVHRHNTRGEGNRGDSYKAVLHHSECSRLPHRTYGNTATLTPPPPLLSPHIPYTTSHSNLLVYPTHVLHVRRSSPFSFVVTHNRYAHTASHSHHITTHRRHAQHTSHLRLHTSSTFVLLLVRVDPPPLSEECWTASHSAPCVRAAVGPCCDKLDRH